MEIESETTPGTFYVVTVDPYANRHELHRCNCNSFRYKGRCKHQKIAHAKICGWNELDGPEKIKDENICPRCGGPAMKGIWEVNE